LGVGDITRIGFAPNVTSSVALCIAPTSSDDQKVVEAVSQIFGSLFASDAHLDILFLNEEQERDVQRACESFL
jgi:hypothetical protein